MGIPMDVGRFSEIAHARLESISAFLLVFLLVVLAVRALWNGLANDFTSLPRIRFRQSLAIVVLFGLGMNLVLAMISGARELMTPGAWTRTGASYRLSFPEDVALRVRRDALTRLGDALTEFAAGHAGRFPGWLEVDAMPGALWAVPGFPGYRFEYAADLVQDGVRRALAWEPPFFGREHLELGTDSTIRLQRYDPRPLATPAAGARQQESNP